MGRLTKAEVKVQKEVQAMLRRTEPWTADEREFLARQAVRDSLAWIKDSTDASNLAKALDLGDSVTRARDEALAEIDALEKQQAKQESESSDAWTSVLVFGLGTVLIGIVTNVLTDLGKAIWVGLRSGWKPAVKRYNEQRAKRAEEHARRQQERQAAAGRRKEEEVKKKEAPSGSKQS